MFLGGDFVEENDFQVVLRYNFLVIIYIFLYHHCVVKIVM